MTADPRRLTIVRYPDPVLHERAAAVESIDDSVRAVARRMLELMHEAEGVGLAAPQVGLSWRLFVTSATEEHPEDRVYVNPKVEPLDRSIDVREEGCLSLPGINVEIRRPASVRLTATNLDNEPVDMQSDGFMARVWQHEFDHLNGVLIIDRMRPIDRLATRKTLKDLEAAARKVG